MTSRMISIDDDENGNDGELEDGDHGGKRSGCLLQTRRMQIEVFSSIEQSRSDSEVMAAWNDLSVRRCAGVCPFSSILVAFDVKKQKHVALQVLPQCQSPPTFPERTLAAVSRESYGQPHRIDEPTHLPLSSSFCLPIPFSQICCSSQPPCPPSLVAALCRPLQTSLFCFALLPDAQKEISI
eukprot:2473329-Rhodomonas_salina.2